MKPTNKSIHNEIHEENQALRVQNNTLKEHIIFLEKDTKSYELTDYIKKLSLNSANNEGILKNLSKVPREQFTDDDFVLLINYIKLIEPLDIAINELMNHLQKGNVKSDDDWMAIYTSQQIIKALEKAYNSTEENCHKSEFNNVFLCELVQPEGE